MKKFLFGPSSGVIALVLLAAHFGMTAIYARYLAADNGLFEQWYLRFGIATIAALLIFHKRINLRKFLHLPRKEWAVLVFRVLTGGVIAIGLYTLAAQNAKIGPVAFMQAVPFLALLGVVLMREKLSLPKGLLVFLSFVGVAIIAVDNPRDLLSFNVGEVFSLISGLFFALAFITRKWHTGKLNNQEITVAMLGLSFVANYILSLTLYQRAFPSTAEWSGLFIFVLFFAGIAAAFSFFLQNYGFERVSGVVAGNILNLEQLLGPLFGYVFYHEGLTIKEVMGGIIILAAVIAMNQLSRKETKVVAVPD